MQGHSAEVYARAKRIKKIRKKRRNREFGEWHARNVARHYALAHGLPWNEINQ